ncbi:MAG: U32 family peptidase [Oligoflexia bacterium]|nr:U32 family peptidase [Oligoflexia bacterium]
MSTTTTSFFSVGTNFDPDLLPQLNNFNVYEVYGKLPKDIIGGGRSAFHISNKINHQVLCQEIKKGHRFGIEFNYLLNAPCLGNIEYTKSGNRKIRKFLDFLSEQDVDTVTVTIPYLAVLIKKNYSNLKVDVSTIARVRNVDTFNSWLDLGVNSITLDDSCANRDWRFLQYVANKQITCKVKLLVNQACTPNCIHRDYHYNVNGHNSQANHISSFPLSFCDIACKSERLNNLHGIIRGQWIRPNDLNIYKRLGINHFKIIQRHDPSSLIMETLKAYYYEQYDGNLLNIVKFHFTEPSKTKKITLAHLLKYLCRPFKFNMLNVYKLSKYRGDNFDLYIDNKKLDGFIEEMIRRDCSNLCRKCGLCQNYFELACSYDGEKRDQLMNKYEKILDLYLNNSNSLFH